MSATVTQTLHLAETAPPNPPRPVPQSAKFNYYLPPADGPGEPSTNDLELILGTKDQDTRHLPLHDLRGREDDFGIDENGFCVVRLESAEKTFTDDRRITGIYYKEIDRLLKEKFPEVKEIHHLGHIIRCALPRTDFSGPTDPAWNKPDRGLNPAPRAHIDFTRLGVHLVLIQAFGEEEALRITHSGRRFLALSIWKPIKTVIRDPLGFCDGRTVDGDDLAPITRIYPDGKLGENVVVKARKGGKVHDWYWISYQTPSEVLLLKLYDSSEEEDVITQIPHASFAIEGTEKVPPRESIELRVVLLF